QGGGGEAAQGHWRRIARLDRGTYMDYLVHMGTTRAPRTAVGDSPAPGAQDRRDPAVRRRLSGPALRTFFSIGRAWGLSATDERALLGWPPTSTFHKYKS